MRAHTTFVLLCCLLSAPAVGCGDGPQRERKRALLQPSDAKRKAAELREKRRLFDGEGELLPSGEVVAGIKLPKGLTLYRRFEQHSYFKSDRIPIEKLERFFGDQLISTSVERTVGSVTYGAAVPRNNLKSGRIEVRITRLRGKENAAEVLIREPPPFRVVKPELDQASFEQARRYAD